MIVAFPGHVDIVVVVQLTESIEGRETVATKDLSTFSDDAHRCPGHVSLNHRADGVEFVDERVLDILQVLRVGIPLQAKRKRAKLLSDDSRDVRNDAVLSQRVFDDRLFRLAWSTELLADGSVTTSDGSCNDRIHDGIHRHEHSATTQAAHL